jgi:hypothetical protein
MLWFLHKKSVGNPFFFSLGNVGYVCVGGKLYFY